MGMQLVSTSVNLLLKHGSEEVENKSKNKSKGWTQKGNQECRLHLSVFVFVGFHKITSLYTLKFL